MKIVHVIPDIARTSGGPSRSSQGMVASLNQAGLEAWLVTCTPGETPWVEGVTHFCTPKSSTLRALKAFFKKTFSELKPDFIHIHAIWMPQLHLAAVVARELKIPYLIAPRGMLEPWSLSQKKWKKRIAWWLYQRNDLARAIALHATAKSEAEQFRKLGFRQQIVLSPNGVLLPTTLPPLNRQKDGVRRLLFISRIHKKKGLLNLVEAWSILRPKGWEVEIVGTDSDHYQSVIEAAVREKGVADDFIFTGPLADECKWNAYRRADVFVLPTYSENFGIVIAEALYAELPVITTVGTPWEELKTHQCGWWIEIGVEPLKVALQAAMALSDEARVAMGQRGRQLVEEKYTWQAIGKQMAEAYRELSE